MISIESKNNIRIKTFKKLKEKKHRTGEGQFLVEGFRLLEEAFKAGKSVHTVIYSKDKEEDFDRYIRPYLKEEEIISASQEVISELSSTVHPQGIVGVVTMDLHPENRLSPEDSSSLLVYLDGLQDPGNLGTIIRSVHASGAEGILLGENTVDPFSEKVIRSSMGSIFYVPIYQNGHQVLDRLMGEGYQLAVTSLEAEKSLYHENLTGKLIVVIGNEGSGITEEIASKADVLLKIPMPGGAESLNAAVAASIVLFERVRQREEVQIL